QALAYSPFCLAPCAGEFIMLYAIAALLFCQLVGEVLVHLSGIPLPGALAGMLVMLAALCFLGRLPDKLRTTSNGLLGHLMLWLIPTVAGVMTQYEALSRDWLPFLIACVGATALTLVVSAAAFRFMLARMPEKDEP